MVLCCGKAKDDDDLAGAKSTGAFVPKNKRKYGYPLDHLCVDRFHLTFVGFAVVNRCRDVLCCLLFLVYWLGMVRRMQSKTTNSTWAHFPVPPV